MEYRGRDGIRRDSRPSSEKVKVDKRLTFNVRHFRRVWPESGDIIQEP